MQTCTLTYTLTDADENATTPLHHFADVACNKTHQNSVTAVPAAF